jgi:hypothetical protein
MRRICACGPGLAVALVSITVAACGGLGGEPPTPPPFIKNADGTRRHVVDRGRYKAFYDEWGRLERIEHDSNGDGRADRITLHREGAKSPHRIEIDVDFDGRIDRWEDFDTAGQLQRYAVADADGRPTVWTYVDEKSQPTRYEYDRDADGRPERAEVVVDGRVARVELDTDQDGRFDRWQDWKDGRMETESLDTDGDGRPDRRLRYGPAGRIVSVERLSP